MIFYWRKLTIKMPPSMKAKCFGISLGLKMGSALQHTSLTILNRSHAILIYIYRYQKFLNCRKVELNWLVEFP